MLFDPWKLSSPSGLEDQKSLRCLCSEKQTWTPNVNSSGGTETSDSHLIKKEGERTPYLSVFLNFTDVAEGSLTFVCQPTLVTGEPVRLSTCTLAAFVERQPVSSGEVNTSEMLMCRRKRNKFKSVNLINKIAEENVH